MRPLSESLELVAREVSDLARMADQLQGLILRLAANGDAADRAVLMEAQAADLFSQRLEGLAGFVRALAEAAPRDIATDVAQAARTLTLAEQARRLSGPSLAPPPDPGEVMTFWD